MYAKMHFGVHFPKENVQLCKNAFVTFCFAKMHLMLPLHFVYKMLESGKMHLMRCKNAFLRTFSKGKCSAYIFQRKMFSITFCVTKCYKCIFAQPKCILPLSNILLCKNAVFFALQKYIFASNTLFASNTFLHQIHFSASNILLC